jgi:hypothetical protein
MDNWIVGRQQSMRVLRYQAHPFMNLFRSSDDRTVAGVWIEGKAACPAGDYWTNEISVRWAKDANSLF